MKQQPTRAYENGVQLRPASIEEAGLFYSRLDDAQDEALGTVGHVRIDFGHGGKEFWHKRGSESMKELTTQTGIIVKCSKTTIEFFQNAQSVDSFSVLEIPGEFQGIAVEFYDLILENDHPTALLGCQGDYDIAVQMNELTGTMSGWHWFK